MQEYFCTVVSGQWSVVYWNMPCFFEDAAKKIIIILLQLTFSVVTVSIVTILTYFVMLIQLFRTVW